MLQLKVTAKTGKWALTAEAVPGEAEWMKKSQQAF